MRAVSKRFLQTLRGSHNMVARARVCTTFQTGTNPAGTEIPIISGDVLAAATSDIRATLNLTTSFEWPRDASGLLSPYGNEIYVERGLVYGNGQTEMVGLGYFRIDTPDQDDTPDGPIDIVAKDRMAGILDARFLTPRQFAAALTRGQVVQALVGEVYPAAVIEWDSPAVRDAAVGRTITAERDRYATLRDLLTSLGRVGYFDHRGVFKIAVPPTVTGTPSWTIDAGRDGVLVKMSRQITREGIYNAVVASGEATDTTPPVWAAVADLSPASPTRWGGRFGQVPRFYSSPFITSVDQARSAASLILRKNLGLPYQVDLEAIANAALEPYDVVQVKYPRRTRSLSLRSEQHVLDTVKIGLGPDSPVTLQTRKQYGEQIGDLTG